MRSRAALLLLLAALAGACKREVPAAPAPPAPPPGINLLDLYRGASVVSRTGEYHYEATAAHGIDNDQRTSWISPPSGPDQTIVVALAARTRVRRFGVHTITTSAARTLRLESSMDGSAWTNVGTFTFDVPDAEPRIRDVEPFETRYLRVHTIAPGQSVSSISDLIVEGDELESPPERSIDGCWTINGRAARFVQRGAEIRGVIDPWEHGQAVHVDGGFDGRAYRLMWRAGKQWGDGLLTVTPDGNAISGTVRRKTAKFQVQGDGWLGTRGPCATTPIDADSVRTRALEVIGRYPLYALRFDAQGRLLAADSTSAIDRLAAMPNVRVVTRASPRLLAAVRDALAARGADASKFELVDRSKETAELMPKLFEAGIEIESK